jgi:predicted ATP-grasp superfamily ATP-dependent carboligase
LNKVPVLILEGDENALSLAHAFHRRNVLVTVITSESNSVLSSRLPFRRFARPKWQNPSDHFAKILFDEPPPDLSGAVVFACSDSAIEFICSFRYQLAERYRLDNQNTELQPRLLDKRTTL